MERMFAILLGDLLISKWTLEDGQENVRITRTGYVIWYDNFGNPILMKKE